MQPLTSGKCKRNTKSLSLFGQFSPFKQWEDPVLSFCLASELLLIIVESFLYINKYMYKYAEYDPDPRSY